MGFRKPHRTTSIARHSCQHQTPHQRTPPKRATALRPTYDEDAGQANPITARDLEQRLLESRVGFCRPRLDFGLQRGEGERRLARLLPIGEFSELFGILVRLEARRSTRSTIFVIFYRRKSLQWERPRPKGRRRAGRRNTASRSLLKLFERSGGAYNVVDTMWTPRQK